MDPDKRILQDDSRDVIPFEECEERADQLMADPDFKVWLRRGMETFDVIEVSIEAGWDFSLDRGEVSGTARY